jgi:hypothetical protein
MSGLTWSKSTHAAEASRARGTAFLGPSCHAGGPTCRWPYIGSLTLVRVETQHVSGGVRAAQASRSGQCRKKRRHFPKDVALLRDEQVVAGMRPAEHAGLGDATFEGSCLPFGHGCVELLEVSGHDVVRAGEDRQRGHASRATSWPDSARVEEPYPRRVIATTRPVPVSLGAKSSKTWAVFPSPASNTIGRPLPPKSSTSSSTLSATVIICARWGAGSIG